MENKIVYPPAGTYVVAVSGGVDSMALLDILSRKPEYSLIVAHVNHGIREDATEDEELVRQIAKEKGLEFRVTHLKLRSSASESEARLKRYEFLREVCSEQGAEAIITAHHLDDRIETMLLNAQRGSSWYGFAPLRETDNTKRPLLKLWKSEIKDYAEQAELLWREDSTNSVADTPRNHVRAQLTSEDKARYAKVLARNDAYREQRLAWLEGISDTVVARVNDNELVVDRTRFLQFLHQDGWDIAFYALKFNLGMSIGSEQITRLVHFVRTARPGRTLELPDGLSAHSERKKVSIICLG